ncbi:MAG: hypothetical protein ACYTBX_19750 [Planctomycetota bacterium]|jgi:hypothetical protein
MTQGNQENPENKVEAQEVQAPEQTPEKAVDEKFQETPEDVEKARAYHQQKSQEETEKRKAVEEERDALLAQLDADDPSRLSATGEPAPAEQKTADKAETTQLPVDDEVDPALRLVLNELRDVKGELADMKQQTVVGQQQEYTRLFKQEESRAQQRVKDYAKKYNIPSDVLQRCDQQAVGIVESPSEQAEKAWRLGTYTRWGKCMLNLLSQHELQSSIQQKATAAKADATAQVDHAKNVSQPGGTAPAPPSPESMEAWNKKEADNIIEDDPPIKL